MLTQQWILAFLSCSPHEGTENPFSAADRSCFYPVPRVRGTKRLTDSDTDMVFLSSPPREGDKQKCTIKNFFLCILPILNQHLIYIMYKSDKIQHMEIYLFIKLLIIINIFVKNRHVDLRLS